jgi:GDP-L-fucose synthase
MPEESRRVAVTGATGFFGRHVVADLRAGGHDVVEIHHVDYDLRERSQIERMLEAAEPDAVVHLAAVVGGIGANQAEPGRFFYDNAIMGIELLEACRVAEVAKVVIAGTVCAYPKLAPIPFRERNLWDGYPEETNAPYGLAKKMLLVQAQAYREQYGSDFVYLLAVNLYGPGDNFDLESGHVIPALIRRFVEALDSGATEVTLWGDGSPTREFLYVGDAARGIRAVLERYDGADPVNLGSGNEISIKELADLVAELVGYSGAISWDTTRPNGQPRRVLDTSRARELFGFAATTGLREGLTNTIAWYRDHVFDASVSH